jgi:ABC-type transporter Mla MlaB component
VSDEKKPGLLAKLKSLFGGSQATSEDTDNPVTRAEERARRAQRKRDEFITKRELEQLRKARSQRDAHFALTRGGAQAGGSSTPQPSSPGGAAKEDTLRKINEIERMMSVDVKGSSPKPAAADLNRAFLPTQPMSPSVQKPVVISSPNSGSQAASPMPGHAFAPTVPDESRALAAAYQKTEMMEPRVSRPASPLAAAMSGNSDFLNTNIGANMMAVEVQELNSDPILEEAAIHFANGDYTEAERSLQNAVSPTGPNHRNVETWRALFDLYRATGDQGKFESLGLDFVGLFETSAPNWFSLSGAGAAAPAAASPGGAPAAASAGMAYTCPPKVDAFVAGQVSQFIETRLMSSAGFTLDFGKLQSVEPDGAEILLKALTSLNKSTCSLTVAKGATLADLAAKLTPAGEREVPQVLWLLRLEALRLLGRNEEFDNTALDYCVTYEVSPPAWQPSKAAVSFADATPPMDWALVEIEGSGESAGPSTFNPEATMSTKDAQRLLGGSAALSGEVIAPHPVITPELQVAARSNPVAISCKELKRIDFSSAGTLLNWVLELQGAGKQVQFSDAHRLVAAFFNVIGISGHARVTLRKD